MIKSLTKLAMIQDWLAANTWTSPEGIVACKGCDNPIAYAGDPGTVPIPYCGNCNTDALQTWRRESERLESKPGLKLPGGYRIDFTGFPRRTVVFAVGLGVFGGSMMSMAMFDSTHKHIPVVTYVEMIGGGLAVLISAILQIVRPR